MASWPPLVSSPVTVTVECQLCISRVLIECQLSISPVSESIHWLRRASLTRHSTTSQPTLNLLWANILAKLLISHVLIHVCHFIVWADATYSKHYLIISITLS